LWCENGILYIIFLIISRNLKIDYDLNDIIKRDGQIVINEF
jgi:hypothetical protein